MHHLEQFSLALAVLIFRLTCASSLYTQAGIVITSAPDPQQTLCPATNLLRRQERCSYGVCGTECLEQGAFCCGPAGTLVTSPHWVCDDGKCITSVRGSTGLVDCYDPANPEGTTQSCIDYSATAICSSTDRCFTCSSNAPFCFWETYIETDPTTLRWFSCVTSNIPDVTFYAATITAGLTSPTGSFSDPISTLSPPPSSAAGPVLSTGGLIGIAVGGGLALITCVAIIAWCCVSMRKRNYVPTPMPENQHHIQSPPAYRPAELELSSPTQYYDRYDRQPLQTSQTLSSVGYVGAASYDEAEAWTPMAELPGTSPGVEIMGLGNFESQEVDRRGYAQGTAYEDQNNYHGGEEKSAHGRENETKEQESDRASYFEGDDCAHMSQPR